MLFKLGMFPLINNIDSTLNQSNNNLGDSYLENLLTYLLNKSNLSFNIKKIHLTIYLNAIGLNSRTQDFINYLSKGYSCTKIISCISLKSINTIYRHHALCKLLCQNDITELNYIPNCEMLANIWSSIFLESLSNNKSFNINYQLVSNGNSLLMTAVQYSMYKCVRALCARNAYVNLRNHNNQTVYHFLNSLDSSCEHVKIDNLLNYCRSRDENNYINYKITPDWTCYNQDKISNMYSCGDSGSSSGGGGTPRSSCEENSRYSAGFKGMTSDGCGAIYSGFNF
jgi:hypothetical protein